LKEDTTLFDAHSAIWLWEIQYTCSSQVLQIPDGMDSIPFHFTMQFSTKYSSSLGGNIKKKTHHLRIENSRKNGSALYEWS
jgi:hypothetical protein